MTPVPRAAPGMAQEPRSLRLLLSSVAALAIVFLAIPALPGRSPAPAPVRPPAGVLEPLAGEAFDLGLLGADWHPTAPGSWSLGVDGSLRAVVLVAREQAPSERLVLDLFLRPAADGGLRGDGFASGIGELAGLFAQLALEGEGEASGRGGPLRLAGELVLHAAPGSSPAPLAGAASACTLAFETLDERASCLEPVVPAAGLSTLGDATCLALEGVGASFVPDGELRFEETADGGACISGCLRDVQDRQRSFELELVLAGRGGPRAGASPVRELAASAYVERGGPVDAGAWTTYDRVQGTLEGRDALQGARLVLSSRTPLQLGLGANGAELEWGLLVVLEAKVEALPPSETFPQRTLGAILRARLGTCP